MTIQFEYQGMEFDLEADNDRGDGLQVFLLISGVTKNIERFELDWTKINPSVYALMQAYFYENYYDDQFEPDGAA